MYAVVETGGKQYRAVPGEYLDVEKLEVEVGSEVRFDRVLLVADEENVTVGQPIVPGAQVVAKVVGQRRHRKVIVFHYVPKKRQRTKNGHRQPFTRLLIESIQA